MQRFTEVVETQQIQIEEQQRQIANLNDALVIAQANTPFKARIAFEKDVNKRLSEIEQQLETQKDDTVCLANYVVEKAILEDRDGFDCFVESSKSWGKTKQELDRDCEVLAHWVSPQCIYEIGLTRVSLSSRSSPKTVKESYIRRSPDIGHREDSEYILDVLWRYRVEDNMLRPETLDVSVEANTHRHLTHLISEHCGYIRIEPSEEPQITKMSSSPKVNIAPVVPVVDGKELTADCRMNQQYGSPRQYSVPQVYQQSPYQGYLGHQGGIITYGVTTSAQKPPQRY
jgi:hypothetical protein